MGGALHAQSKGCCLGSNTVMEGGGSAGWDHQVRPYQSSCILLLTGSRKECETSFPTDVKFLQKLFRYFYLKEDTHFKL